MVHVVESIVDFLRKEQFLGFAMQASWKGVVDRGKYSNRCRACEITMYTSVHAPYTKYCHCIHGHTIQSTATVYMYTWPYYTSTHCSGVFSLAHSKF